MCIFIKEKQCCGIMIARAPFKHVFSLQCFQKSISVFHNLNIKQQDLVKPGALLIKYT